MVKKIVYSLIVCFAVTIAVPSYAQTDTQTAQEQRNHRNAQIAVGLYRIGEKVVHKIRSKKSQKKLDKMVQKGAPAADCYFINEKGYLDVYSGPCDLPDGTHITDLLCPTCVELKEKYRKKHEHETQPVQSHQDNIPSLSQGQNLGSPSSSVEEQQELEKQRLEAERLERERIEAERRAAEEKKVSIEKISNVVLCEYKFDVVELSDSQKQELDKVAEVMNKYNDVSILLTGHTCKIGYKNINQRKGLQRANGAKDYLVGKGIAEERIQTDSKGELEPIADNNTFEGRAKNRRVEISIAK
ncbi:MAG: OmpA family protein [Bacteroidales bacterium]|nr:OmpA family protein [Bacteroidales bacterium]